MQNGMVRMHHPIAQLSGKDPHMQYTQVKETTGDRIFSIVNYFVLSLVLIIVLYPLVYILSASFSDARAVTSGRVWLWPVNPTLAGYEAIFKNKLLLSGFGNSLFYTVFGTIINVVLTILAAYPLSRPDLPGRTVLTFLFFFTTIFSGGLIPTYLVVKDLGMLNTRWAMLLPVALSVWNLLIMRTYFQTTIPKELHDAAQLDGCDEFNYLVRVVLPLSGPIIAVIALFYAIGHWNSFFTALIYLNNKALWPLQLVLREVLVQNQIDPGMLAGIDPQQLALRQQLRELLKYSLIVVATGPLLMIYPFVQKHFVRGIMLGSVKG
jgi:multiple sugar transport system permease protein/putative aldouronate transport system permease protein